MMNNTESKIKRAMEIINIISPLYEELDKLLSDLEDSNDIDNKSARSLYHYYRELPGTYLFYDVQEALEEIEIIESNEEDDEDGENLINFYDPDDEELDNRNHEELNTEEDDILIELDKYREDAMDYGQRVFLATEKVEDLMDYIDCRNNDINKIYKKLDEILELLKTKQEFGF